MAKKAAERLLGTCQDITDLGGEYEDLQDNKEFCEALDGEVFKCEMCGWWCENHEASEIHADKGQLVCDECAPARDEDD